ncbi:hypothetical protein EI94DRAFT_1743083 [Lactarius quietus]|nr:hypothetical protein EI94DRAFT_1743083 [Lactarius quietus]
MAKAGRWAGERGGHGRRTLWDRWCLRNGFGRARPIHPRVVVEARHGSLHRRGDKYMWDKRRCRTRHELGRYILRRNLDDNAIPLVEAEHPVFVPNEHGLDAELPRVRGRGEAGHQRRCPTSGTNPSWGRLDGGRPAEARREAG